MRGSIGGRRSAVAPSDRLRRVQAEAPRVLFLPRCGANGIGEYVRCLLLAGALRRRHPHAAIELALTPSWPRLPGDDFPRAPLARGASQADLAAILARLRPHLVVTNNRGGSRELALARAQGAAVVAIASTERRRRARRVGVLRHVDQLWIVPGEGRGAARLPSFFVRWLAGWPHCEIVETLHPAPDPARAAERLAGLGLEGRRYVLFASGGGGWPLGGRAAGDVFAAAAAQVAATGVRAVVVAGPLHRGENASREGVTWQGELEPEAMVDLAACAEVVVCAGGGFLGQVLSLGRPCVATPMPVADQRQRTAACRDAGTALVVEGTADALAAGALALLGDRARREALAETAASAGPRNALPRCVELLEELLRTGSFL
jgi:UDP:flavonoid glycosyltransferase YjiC (YdhE family)